MGKICDICGKPSGIYPLCSEHLKEKANGDIVKCPDCGKWHYCFLNCDCSCDNVKESEKKDNNVIKIDTNSKSKCIACGKSTDGLLFCSSCYHKYKNKRQVIKSLAFYFFHSGIKP